MIVVANRLSVAPGYEAAFEQRFAERESHLRRVPGFIRNLVLRPIQGSTYVAMTFWQAHTGPSTPEMYSAPGVLEIHEVVQLIEA